MSKATQRLAAAVVTLIAGACVLVPATASANSPIYEFHAGPSTTQAGGHPDIHSFSWTGTRENQSYPEPNCYCQDVKQVTVDFPSGVIGSPQNVPHCSIADFGAYQCPIDTQVGVIYIGIAAQAPPNPPSYPVPVFNLQPHPNQAGLLGFPAPYINSPIFIAFEPRTEGDYGATAIIQGITHFRGLSISDLTLWGVPADPSHDPLRLQPIGCDSQGTGNAPFPCKGGASSNAPLKPFLTNPTACEGPLTARIETLSYDKGTDSATAPYAATTACDQLSFNPSLFAQPTTRSTDSATGLDVDLKVPLGESPVAPSPSEIRASSVTLPEGFSINPNVADGKSSCSDAEARVTARYEAAQCPEFSKIGSLAIKSPALPGSLHGYIYLREPIPGDPYRIWLVADEFGIHSKIPGSIHADPQTGRLTTVFPSLPQFPLEEFILHFFGSERGAIATPERCGTYAVESTFTPWADALPEQTSSQFFTIDSGPGGTSCPNGPRPLNPTFQAGVSDKTAAAHAPFALEIKRPDGDQNLTGLQITTPPGFSAILKGIPYCPEAAIAQLGAADYSGLAEQALSACPAASKVGTSTAGAGAGSRPLYVGGKVYLAGPYKGAPLSLVVVVPAVSGPYDLGNVVVRAAIRIDPLTAQVTTVSDPFPQIIEGIPIRTRYIQIDLNRPDFAINPTNCDPFSVDATISGDEGGSTRASSIFQAANCADLGYAPKLKIALSGGVRRLGHPAIHAVLKTGLGDSNTRKVSVALPEGELLDQAHLGSVCTRVAFAARTCPESSRIGTATVTTPLLDEPLTGSVYLRSSSQGLPDMALDLDGQIDFEAVARVDSPGGRLRATFANIPDVPLGTVTLDLLGGSKGLVQNSESLCGAQKKARVRMTGQNGEEMNTRLKLSAKCRSKTGRKSRGGHGR